VVDLISFVLLGLVAALIVFWITRSILAYLRDRQPAHETDEPDAAAEEDRALVVAAPPDAAELLARHGRFTEAIHALFLKCLALLTENLGYRPGPSATGREVVRKAPLADPVRAPLGSLLQAVEVAVFGGREATESDYQACVGHYAAFRRLAASGMPRSKSEAA
jgi:hypothetical protein